MLKDPQYKKAVQKETPKKSLSGTGHGEDLSEVITEGLPSFTSLALDESPAEEPLVKQQRMSSPASSWLPPICDELPPSPTESLPGVAPGSPALQAVAPPLPTTSATDFDWGPDQSFGEMFAEARRLPARGEEGGGRNQGQTDHIDTYPEDLQLTPLRDHVERPEVCPDHPNGTVCRRTAEMIEVDPRLFHCYHCRRILGEIAHPIIEYDQGGPDDEVLIPVPVAEYMSARGCAELPDELDTGKCRKRWRSRSNHVGGRAVLEVTARASRHITPRGSLREHHASISKGARE